MVVGLGLRALKVFGFRVQGLRVSGFRGFRIWGLGWFRAL